MSLAYHLAFFSSLNPLAYAIAGLPLAGAGIFFCQGIVHCRLEFKLSANARTAGGLGLGVFSLVLYPLWSYYAGHRYPALPTFGLPCLTTLFTIGLLAFLVAPYPRSLFVIPVLWCFVGAQAAFLFDMSQDLGLILAGVAGIVLLLRSKVTAPRVGLSP